MFFFTVTLKMKCSSFRFHITFNFLFLSPSLPPSLQEQIHYSLGHFSPTSSVLLAPFPIFST